MATISNSSNGVKFERLAQRIQAHIPQFYGVEAEVRCDVSNTVAMMTMVIATIVKFTNVNTGKFHVVYLSNVVDDDVMTNPSKFMEQVVVPVVKHSEEFFNDPKNALQLMAELS